MMTSALYPGALYEASRVRFGCSGWLQQRAIDGSLALPSFDRSCEPVRVVKRQPRHGKEQHDTEAHHGKVDMQPTCSLRAFLPKGHPPACCFSAYGSQV